MADAWKNLRREGRLRAEPTVLTEICQILTETWKNWIKVARKCARLILNINNNVVKLFGQSV